MFFPTFVLTVVAETALYVKKTFNRHTQLSCKCINIKKSGRSLHNMCQQYESDKPHTKATDKTCCSISGEKTRLKHLPYLFQLIFFSDVTLLPSPPPSSQCVMCLRRIPFWDCDY